MDFPLLSNSRWAKFITSEKNWNCMTRMTGLTPKVTRGHGRCLTPARSSTNPVESLRPQSLDFSHSRRPPLNLWGGKLGQNIGEQKFLQWICGRGRRSILARGNFKTQGSLRMTYSGKFLLTTQSLLVNVIKWHSAFNQLMNYRALNRSRRWSAWSKSFRRNLHLQWLFHVLFWRSRTLTQIMSISCGHPRT